MAPSSGGSALPRVQFWSEDGLGGPQPLRAGFTPEAKKVEWHAWRPSWACGLHAVSKYALAAGDVAAKTEQKPLQWRGGGLLLDDAGPRRLPPKQVVE